LDRQKKRLCQENEVRLIEWPYDTPPTAGNIRKVLVSFMMEKGEEKYDGRRESREDHTGYPKGKR
ncbi:MAG: hypothetical protein IKX76_00620, partial [Eubacterium sp.]|nr:hypothetical protein [Eubacterium sp.]